MPDPQPTPTPAEPPAPQEPTPPQEPTAPTPQPTSDPEPKPHGEPDEFERMKREMSEVKELIKSLQPQEPAPAASATPDPTPNLDEVKEKYQAEAKAWAIERELLKAGCVDADAAMVHINAAEVELAEDGKTVEKGLDLEEIKKSYPYLFPQQINNTTVSTNAQGAIGGSKPTQAKTIAEGLKARQTAN